MTVYKAIKAEAEAAAELAVALLRDEEPPPGLVTGTVDNGEAEVPAVLLEPVAVTQDNVETTVIDDGFWSVDEICTQRYEQACETAGIQ
jgi:D-xylose transport system substrate-binding protein